MVANAVVLMALGVALLALLHSFIDRRRYAQKLSQLRMQVSEAQRVLDKRGQLANEIAHEIKNPITAILCSAETLDLLLANQIEPEHRESLRYIKQYGDHLLRIVSDFIDVSRAESGNIRSTPESFDVCGVIDSIAGLLQGKAQSKHITLKLPNGEKVPRVFFDQKHLKQISFNLLHNALKFTPEGGEVHISIRDEFPHPFVRLAVKDNGVGISADMLPTIFDPYTHRERFEDDADSGTGLGLALCKMLVELGKGRIEVRSKVGVGTTFEVFLPKDELDRVKCVSITDNDTTDTAVQLRPLDGQRFLVVDENSGARESVARLIEAWGGVVDGAEEIAKALDALTRHRYDAVVVDDLPTCSAAQLSRIIRGKFPHDRPCIVSTSAHNSGNTEGSRTCGDEADEHVVKPLNGKTLLESLLGSTRQGLVDEREVH